jgi:hypothetical protein
MSNTALTAVALLLAIGCATTPRAAVVPAGPAAPALGDAPAVGSRIAINGMQMYTKCPAVVIR